MPKMPNEHSGKPDNELLINGRRFYQHGDHWVDATVDEMPAARRIRVRFDSKEYFDLIIRHSGEFPLISGARNLQVALADTIYEIYER